MIHARGVASFYQWLAVRAFRADIESKISAYCAQNGVTLLEVQEVRLGELSDVLAGSGDVETRSGRALYADDLAAEIASKEGISASTRGESPVFDRGAALRLIEACAGHGCFVLGLRVLRRRAFGFGYATEAGGIEVDLEPTPGVIARANFRAQEAVRHAGEGDLWFEILVQRSPRS